MTLTTQPMARRAFWAGLIGLGLLLFMISSALDVAAQSNSRRATVLSLAGPVTPASASYLEREISAASDRQDALIVLEIDTPGGLVDSMKSIIKAVLASETPVATFVSPQGARSASAGLYIMYSAHISAMAPATNTGSATPIAMGDTGDGGEPLFPSPTPSPTDESEETDGDEPSLPVDISNEASLRGKIIEDSVAYIRSLAELRGRNAEWAEKAVRPPSASISANEALELNVIDYVADDLDDLLEKIDGEVVETPAGSITLDTEGLVVERVEPTLVERILGFFANPNVAAILLTLGTTGIIVEMWNPGSIFPGAVGALSLILAFYSFQVLPYNIVPLAVMGLGGILIVIEIFTPTFGLAGATGIGLFTLGLYFLFPDDFRVAPGVLIGTVGTAGVFLVTALLALVRSRGHGPLIGKEAIRKREGRVDVWSNEEGSGYVIVDGERWQARSKDTLSVGDRIRVADVDGIVLVVRRLNEQGSKFSFLSAPKRKSRKAAKA